MLSFLDYFKYFIWYNVYFVIINEFFDDNVLIYVLECEVMFQGVMFGVQCLGILKFFGGGFQVVILVDWDGNNFLFIDVFGYVVRMYDDVWDGGQDKVELWEVYFDWVDDVVNFVFGFLDMVGVFFDVEICFNGSFFDCIE